MGRRRDRHGLSPPRRFRTKGEVRVTGGVRGAVDPLPFTSPPPPARPRPPHGPNPPRCPGSALQSPPGRPSGEAGRTRGARPPADTTPDPSPPLTSTMAPAKLPPPRLSAERYGGTSGAWPAPHRKWRAARGGLDKARGVA